MNLQGNTPRPQEGDLFFSYKSAHEAAVLLARRLGREVGLWNANKSGYYGKREAYTIRSLPRPENRYGHELTCEVVKPGDPL